MFQKIWKTHEISLHVYGQNCSIPYIFLYEKQSYLDVLSVWMFAGLVFIFLHSRRSQLWCEQEILGRAADESRCKRTSLIDLLHKWILKCCRLNKGVYVWIKFINLNSRWNSIKFLNAVLWGFFNFMRNLSKYKDKPSHFRTKHQRSNTIITKNTHFLKLLKWEKLFC